MTDRSKTPPFSLLGISSLDPAARENPHQKLGAMRDACPAHWDQDAKTWMLTRYDDVKAFANDRTMLRHPSNAEEGSLVRQSLNDRDDDIGRRPSILFMDDPDHTRVRQPIAKAFYARINHMKDQIEAVIDEVLDGVPKSGRFDLIGDIAIPVPILVIARILGVEQERVGEFRAWSEAAILSLNPFRTADETKRMFWGREQLNTYFQESLDRRRTDRQDDLITDMAEAQAEGLNLTDDEILINLQGLLVGGNLTTTDLIGNGVWLLLRHADELAKLKADPGLAGATVEEVLRYESPVAATSRVLPDARDVGGCPLGERQSVWLSLHSANRDAALFDNADAFNITREHVPHVAFGGGTHICIGAPLARIEARKVFADLFQRFPNMTLPEQEITWRQLPFFRGMEHLWVEV